MTEQTMGEKIMAAVDAYNADLPRSKQELLGVSDVGGCREYGRRVVAQIEPSDTRSTWPASLGTAVDAFVKTALDHVYSNVMITDAEVEVAYPNGATLTGHPDVVCSHGVNAVIDIKTRDGVIAVGRSGPTMQQRFQVHSYAKGLIDAGVLTGTPTCIIVWLDRSGSTADTFTWQEPYDPAVVNEASIWIEDVMYAVRSGEEASKDKPFDFCERYCQFFTDCRKQDWDPEGLLQDEEVVSAADLYLEGMATEKRGKLMKGEAKKALIGVSGSTGRALVRWTYIGPSEIPSLVRNGYDRLDVKAVK